MGVDARLREARQKLERAEVVPGLPRGLSPVEQIESGSLLVDFLKQAIGFIADRFQVERAIAGHDGRQLLAA